MKPPTKKVMVYAAPPERNELACAILRTRRLTCVAGALAVGTCLLALWTTPQLTTLALSVTVVWLLALLRRLHGLAQQTASLIEIRRSFEAAAGPTLVVAEMPTESQRPGGAR